MTKQSFYTTNSGAFQEVLALVGKMFHAKLVRQIEYLKVENQILRSKVGVMISVTPAERSRILKFGLPLKGDIRRLISIVRYSTFRTRVRTYTNCKVRKYSKRGRPRTIKQIRDIILRLARENNWGYTRILAELKKLRISRLSRNTVKNILKENGLLPAPKRSEDTWDNFIKRHFKTLWACDFFTKTVWTVLGPRTFHALFFINVRTRRVHIAGITKHPSREWVNNRARSVSFLFRDDNKSKLLIRDGDGKYSPRFDKVFKEFNVNVKKIPYRSPNLNPYAEGWVGTMKRECLDHFFVFGERHFRYLVSEYVKYYNTKRPHPGIKYKIPIDTGQTAVKTSGRLRCKETLGGLARHYYWG